MHLSIETFWEIYFWSTQTPGTNPKLRSNESCLDRPSRPSSVQMMPTGPYQDWSVNKQRQPAGGITSASMSSLNALAPQLNQLQSGMITTNWSPVLYIGWIQEFLGFLNSVNETWIRISQIEQLQKSFKMKPNSNQFTGDSTLKIHFFTLA